METANVIKLSESAVKKLKELQQENKMLDGGLRLAVAGGGCSGLSYRLDFEKSPKENDKEFVQDGVRVFVDPKSFLYLKGMTLDYEGGLNGQGFTFQNPNAKKSCGCGSSFSV